MTICSSLWRPLVEDSKQQLQEDSSCCQNVTENFSELFAVVLESQILN